MSLAALRSVHPGLWLALGGAILLLVGKKKANPPPTGAPGRYFTWSELTTTSKNLDNTPTPEAADNLRALTANLLDPLRERLGRPLGVNSGYRSPVVNAAVGGSKTSQHMTGEAVDLEPPAGFSSIEFAQYVLDSGLPVDQVIWYDKARGGHTHVSFSHKRNRRQTLHAAAGSSGYEPWTPRPAPAAVAGIGTFKKSRSA